ncbi:uncharacterized protein F4822DRAFT_443432 [Hypoxylon trugodes]|uniref:uncharacterized protein n=1 Tax=Hypoxylon trugodes TaxID=326681 RepID=UPI002194A569|nr:uncharacterized protein F4822DRAFT_443432 [Hypoxylon trugodes]KAI1388482.1 hypothetical protein F4822DRAFT_443432 [Hypoxylon trugodes]
MRISLLTLIPILTALTAATPTPVQQADPSATFYAELFSTASDCSATSGIKAFLYSRGACQNIAVPGTGSARVRYNEQPDTLTLTGWTGANCTGDAVVVGSEVGVCVSLDGRDVVSWSY